MPDNDKNLSQQNLKQQFERLPHTEPPFGLDTRIKAHARDQIEQRQTARARQRRVNAGLATAACAVLVIVIARPLLQQPLSEHQVPNTVYESEEMDYSSPQPSSQPTVVESSATRMKSIQKLNGGGAKPQAQFESNPQGQISAPAAANMEADVSTDEKSLSRQSLAEIEESVPALDKLLEQLREHQSTGNFAQAAEVIELITRHYPEHTLD